MSPTRTILMLALVFWIATSCSKDDGPNIPSGVSITFRADSGYTFVSGVVPTLDTLLVEAIIREGSDPLERFYLARAYDDSAVVGLDTAQVNNDPFTYTTQFVTRGQPGTEELIFTVEEADGDRTTRRLTFTVQ